MLRNPVDRYLSCRTHHMMMGRIAWTEEITEIDDRLSTLSLGYYRRIYDLYAQEFSTIHTLLYDDLVADKRSFVAGVMARLGLRNDIPRAAQCRHEFEVQKAPSRARSQAPAPVVARRRAKVA